MLLEKTDFNKEEFLQVFNKKFSNFAEKCPLFIQYKVIDDYVLIEDKSDQQNILESLKYIFDFTLGVKENIKNIKDILLETRYPTFVVSSILERQFSTSEIQQKMQKENVSFKDASNLIHKEIQKTRYRIEKIINQDNRLIIRKLFSNEEPALYQMSIPAILFLQKVFSSSPDVGTIFTSKSMFIKFVPDITTA